MDFVAGFTSSQAVIDVFPAVLIVGAQPTQFLPGSAVKESAGGGDGLEAARNGGGGMVGRKARVEVMWRNIESEDYPGVLDGFVGVEQLRSHDGRFRMVDRVRHQIRQPASRGDGVVVEQDDKVARCRRGAGVTRRGK